jgi:hypothetical protein
MSAVTIDRNIGVGVRAGRVLGGAIALQLRVGNPVFSHLLFGVYLGVMLWTGLWLRSPVLRAVFALR